MAQFDDQSIKRISRTVRGWERRQKNGPSRRGRWQNKPGKIVFFELLEALTQWSGSYVSAARRYWDPAASYGNGGWVTDCDDTLIVADLNAVGHTAGAGGLGCAVMNAREDGTLVGTIIDLCCPGDEQGECLGSGSGSGS